MAAVPLINSAVDFQFEGISKASVEMKNSFPCSDMPRERIEKNIMEHMFSHQ